MVIKWWWCIYVAESWSSRRSTKCWVMVLFRKATEWQWAFRWDRNCLTFRRFEPKKTNWTSDKGWLHKKIKWCPQSLVGGSGPRSGEYCWCLISYNASWMEASLDGISTISIVGMVIFSSDDGHEDPKHSQHGAYHLFTRVSRVANSKKKGSSRKCERTCSRNSSASGLRPSGEWLSLQSFSIV